MRFSIEVVFCSHCLTPTSHRVLRSNCGRYETWTCLNCSSLTPIDHNTHAEVSQ